MIPDMTKYKMLLGACVSLNSVHREILSSVTIDSYDKSEDRIKRSDDFFRSI